MTIQKNCRDNLNEPVEENIKMSDWKENKNSWVLKWDRYLIAFK